MQRKNKRNRFGVIGYGRFGHLWASVLSSFGDVLVHDKKSSKGKMPRGVSAATFKDTLRSDIVFFAVPISKLESALTSALPHLEKDTLVIDTCSVKIEPAKALKRILPKGQPVMATHPLFGPDSAKMNGGIRGLKIAVSLLGSKTKQKKEALLLFKKMGLRVLLATPEAHDRSMAPSHALVHLIGRGLADLKLKPRDIATPDYAALVRIAEIVGNDTWELFYDMQEKNPYADPMREKFISNLENVETRIVTERNDLETLRDAIKKTDARIIQLLSRRTRLSEKIGVVKRKQGLHVQDPKRERELSRYRVTISRMFHVSPKLVEDLFRRVVAHSKKIQKQAKI